LLGPPLLLAVLLGSTQSLSMCLQVATLAGVVMLVGLHVSFGDPQQFWAPFVREMAQQMQQRGLPMDLERTAWSIPWPARSGAG
jgi:Flp pilus assembly protein protease CpaA